MSNDADSQDRRLWDRAKPLLPAGQAPPVEPIELASWLDGRCDEPTARRVEAALAANPDLLEQVLDIRAASPSLEALPEGLTARAKGLVAAQAAASVRAAHRRRWWPIEWAATAAAVIVVSFAGYSFGKGTYHARTDTEVQASAAMSIDSDSILGDEDSPSLPAGQAGGQS